MMKHVLQTGCLILGILCLLYFAGIMLYVGSTEWFQFVWLAAGGMFLILRYMLIYQSMHPGSLVRYLTGTAFVLIAAGVLVICVIGSRIVGTMTAEPEENLDYVIVLGAQVRGTRPSRALRKRLDRALEYAKENQDTVFIVSGGQGADEEISEALCMYQYMEENGMDMERVIQEDRSTSTLENLEFSAEFLDKKEDRIGILSNNFHIYRALALAKQQGYEQICGIPAHSDPFMQPHYVLREICAVLVLMLRGTVSL